MHSTGRQGYHAACTRLVSAGIEFSMQELIKAYSDILLRRQGPDVLPSSSFLLQLAFISYCLVNLVALLIEGSLARSPLIATLAVVFDGALLGVWFWVLLSASGRPGRMRQTLSAALGCGAIIGLYMLPVVVLLRLVPRAESLAVLAYFLLLFWFAAVLGHIGSRALEIHPLAGLGLGIFYIFASLVIVSSLFPLGT